MARPDEAANSRLLSRLRKTQAQIILFIAPAGYGKTALAQAWRADYRHTAVCDCFEISTLKPFIENVLAALSEADPERGDFFLQLRVSLAAMEDELSCKNLLFSAWTAASAESLFIFENVEAIGRDRVLSEMFVRLLSSTPLERKVVVCTRTQLRMRSGRHLPPHRLLKFTTPDFVLQDDEAARLLEYEHVPEEYESQILELAQGWPIALLLLARLAREGRITGAMLDASKLEFDDLFEYFLHEVLYPLDPHIKRILTLCATVPDITHDELAQVLDIDMAVLDTVAADVPLLFRRGNLYTIHPLAREAIAKDQPDPKNLLVDVASACERAGRYSRAARLYRLAGDSSAAACALAHLPVAELTCGDTLLELLHVPLEMVRMYPKLAALFMHKTLTPQIRELLEQVFAGLSEADDAETIATVAWALHYACVCTGAIDSGRDVLSDPRVARAANTSPAARKMLIGLPEVNAAFAGRRKSTESDLRVMYEKSLDGYYMTSLLIAESLASSARWSGRHQVAAHWHEEALRHVRGIASDSYATEVIMALYNAWFFGDDVGVARYRRELEQGASAGYVPAFGMILRAIDPRTIDAVLSDPANVSVRDPRSFLIAASFEDDMERRLRLVRRAEPDALSSGQGVAYALVLIARAALEPSARAELLSKAASAIDANEMQELHQALLAYRDKHASFLDPFIARFSKADTAAEAVLRGQIQVHVLRESVSIAHRPIKITPRDAGLLAFLSRRRQGASREEIQAALWPEFDEIQARDALYSLLYRLRKRAGTFEIVKNVGNAYRLSPDVAVDIWDIELLAQNVQRGAVDSEEEVEQSYAAIRHRSYPHLMQFEWFSTEDFRIRDYERTLAGYLVDRAAERSDYASMLTYSSDLLREDDCDEWAYEVAIRAYVGMGEKYQAARTYQKYKAIVRRELNAEPSNELRSLLERHRVQVPGA